MRALLHPERSDLNLDRVLAALADPMRRSVVAKLMGEGAGHACAAFDLPVAKSTATHHFRVLREAGLIRQEYHGTEILNSLRQADIEARFPGLLDAVSGL